MLDSNIIIIKMPEITTDLVTAIPVTTEQMTYSNKVYLSPLGNISQDKKFISVKGYILSVAFSDLIPKGKMGLNKKFRQFLVLSLIEQTIIKSYEKNPEDKPASSLTLKIQMLLPPKEKQQVDDLALISQFKKQFKGYYVAVDQVFVMNFNKTPYVVSVDRILGLGDRFIFVSDQTKIETVASGDQKIRLKSAKDVKRNVFADNFSKDSLGIGGLDNELTSLFRRAFASRRLPHSVIERFGIKHVKGILLYGPPGTGKTLIARQLAKSLKAKSLQIVNGPEVFSKFVGQSEQNIRKLFEPARNDEKKYGDESPIHVIVFDEIDAICRQRGSDGGSAGSKDAVVNQLLTNLDGVEALNNIIVIGMTNRKDLIDEAILRPGRLEVHIEIGIPSQEGRLQILKIHTKRLSEERLLGKDVKLQQLAKQAKNYTGAEIQAVVKNASSFAMSKGNNIMDFSKKLEIKAGTTVDQNDFQKALVEIIPGFGVDQQNFNVFLRGQLINYGSRFQKIMNVLRKISSIHLSGSRQVTSVLLHGEPGTGKTSIAAHFGFKSQFTYVKIISPERYIGMNTWGRVYAINKIFSDAYKAKESLIIIDNIERLIQFVTATRDFNNALMQAMLVLIKKIPTNPECRIMIIGTISNYVALERLEIDKAFGIKIETPLLNQDECKKVLGQNLNLQKISVKQLTNFKDIVRDKPKQKWAAQWEKYHS